MHPFKLIGLSTSQIGSNFISRSSCCSGHSN
jgi:hypothetical protein